MTATTTLEACNTFATKLRHWQGGLGITPRTLQVVVRHAGTGLEVAAIWEGQTLIAEAIADPAATPEQVHMLVGLALAREQLEVKA